ncbi:hypothetical protein [Prosthecobacter vanneervenii]|uniref:Uncharacterized protein n=1 Tax=Prosthecobacter vanneervenii TaxID=48466 RepID=A0A7W8DI51_9BACT|nr:hypothetical protein [Prosthecobacter vanneervenii]MBB5030516.1 hypothetical protein [Prosthecobacter vanneervenii]
MTDTVTLMGSLPVNKRKLEMLKLSLPRDKRCSNSVRMYQNEDRGIHKLSSINTTFHLNKDNQLFKVECDLPHLLYGHTGRLISNEGLLQKALYRLDSLIKSVLEDDYAKNLVKGLSAVDQMYFKRVDLVWQYNMAMPLLTPVMRLAKHKRINCSATVHGNQNVTFSGKNLKAVFYDKKLKMHRKPGGVTRIEFKVEGKAFLTELFKADKKMGLTALHFDDLYERYRELLLGFANTDKCAIPNGRSIEDFLAIAEMRHPGITEIYCQVRCSKRQTRSKLRAKIKARKMQTFNLDDLVPADSIPSVVEVEDLEVEDEFNAMIKRAGLFC